MQNVRDSWKRHGSRAIAELLVVVLGVSIAFSVESWKARRDDREQERAYLEQLHADFRQNSTTLHQALEVETQNERAAIALLEAIHRPQEQIRPDSLSAWMFRALNSSDARFAGGTYSALIESGDLRLVADDELRSALAAFAGKLNTALEGIRYWNDVAFLQLVTDPYFVKEVGVFELYSDNARTERALPLPNRFPIDWPRLLGEKEFGGLVTTAYLTRLNRRRAIESLLTSVDELVEMLSRSIEQGT